MILADKIIRLRKQLGWSQEELAEKMDVSRQSVSKWESTNSIPDLNKIIKLAEIFNVSTDFLLKDEVETAEYLNGSEDTGIAQISLEQALKYVDIKVIVADLVAKGVALCVCSAIPLFFLLAMAETSQLNLTGDTAAALGIASIFVMIALGVSFFIKTNRYKRELAPIDSERFELSYGVHSVFTEELEKFSAVYQKRLSMGVALFIFSTIPLLLVAILTGKPDTTLLMVIVMLLMIAAGIYMVMPAATQFDAYNYILVEGDLDAGKSKRVKQAEKLAAFYWPLLVAIYLGWSFWTMSWGITWIIFPVGAVAFAALVGLMGLLDKDDAR